MSDIREFQRVVERTHNNLYANGAYTAEFYNYPDPGSGDYDPNTGEINEGSRSKFGTIQVEFVPPAIDTTVDTDGTSFSWDTSIRFPEDKSVVGSLQPLGDDNKRPTEVDITDQEDSSTVTYELHGYTTEVGSGMIMARLIEQ